MRNWFEILQQYFVHPSIVLWRSVELGCIENAMSQVQFREPILDLGCAEGDISGALFNGYSLIGIDTSWDLLKQNRHREVYRGLALADGCRMPFRHEGFNTVFSNCVIEHIPDLERLLGEVSAVLKPGGRFLFTVPSASFGGNLSVSVFAKALCLNALARSYARFRNTSLHHYHCYDRPQWETLLENRGFRLIQVCSYMDRRMTVIWDLLAIFWRILAVLRIPRSVLQRLNKFLIKHLKRYYNIYSSTGSGLLVVAEKQEESVTV